MTLQLKSGDSISAQDENICLIGGSNGGLAKAFNTDAAGNLTAVGGSTAAQNLEAAYTAAQTNTAILSVSDSNRIVVTAIDFVCDAANTVNVAVRIGFGATTTPTTTGVLLSHPGLFAGSGLIKGNGGGILGIGGAGEDLRITASVPTTGSMRVIVTAYTVPA